jgi:hypothetical protein
VFDPIINSDNDDDIFDDSKSLSDSNPSSDSHFTPLSNKDKSSVSDMLNDAIFELFSEKDGSQIEAEQLLQHLKSKHNIDFSTILGNLRLEFTQTFYESVHKWVFNHKIVDTPIAVYDTLTLLTDGKYPLYAKYRELEISIPKRKTVLKFLDTTFCSKKAEQALNKIGDLFGAELDSRFLKTYFQSVYEMIYFTMIQEIGLYKALSEEVGIPFDETLIDPNGPAYIASHQERRDQLFSQAMNPNLERLISSNILAEMEKYGLKEGK